MATQFIGKILGNFIVIKRSDVLRRADSGHQEYLYEVECRLCNQTMLRRLERTKDGSIHRGCKGARRLVRGFAMRNPSPGGFHKHMSGRYL